MGCSCRDGIRSISVEEKNPPQWAVDRYKLDNGMVENIDNEYLYFDWLKSQEQKIQKIEENIIFITKELGELKKWQMNW